MESPVEMRLQPIGTVRNKIKEPSLVPKSGDLEWKKTRGRPDRRDLESELIIDSSFEQCLDGLEEFSHLIVLYWMHRVSPEERSITKVHPRGNANSPLTGIFATRSPARPNPIGVITVRLLEHKGNILKVSGLDAIDGTPLIDIKPLLPGYDSAPQAKTPDWIRSL